MIGETLDENDDFVSEKQGRSREFPLVKLDLIQAATQNFSEENKLGEGGFGPVYKVTIPIIYHNQLPRKLLQTSESSC